jgi:pimeloyl-ACP methyl ester carboxylesterase
MSAARIAGILVGLVMCATAPVMSNAQQRSDGQPVAGWASNGETVWISTPSGRLKTHVYKSAHLGPGPVLILAVHGDIPNPPPDYQYAFAQMTADAADNVVAAGVLRPGYKDTQGDRSDGDMGFGVGDNYTPQAVDELNTAVLQLKRRYHAKAVILVGHSGGGAIAADLLGRHPKTADGAVLVSCGCDPKGFMKRWRAENPDAPKNIPYRSLSPLDFAANVSPNARITLVVGSQDEVAGLPRTRAYANALAKHGVKAKLVIVPDAGHNILISRPVFRELGELVQEFGGVMPAIRTSPATR